MNRSVDDDFQRGFVALRAGRLNDAERLLRAVVGADAKHVQALNLLGIVLGRLGRNGEAVESFDRALAAAPDLTESWYGRGMTLLTMGRPLDAIASFDRVLAGKPDFTQVHLLRAKLLSDLGRHDAALAGIDKLLAIMPGFAETWLGRSNVLFALKRYADALTAAEKAISLKPDLAEGWHGCGNALSELERYGEALNAYNKAIALNPNFAGAWHGRANVLSELRCYHDAVAAYDKALTLAPHLVEAWLGRGNALNRLGDSDEALAAFARALSLHPNLAEAWLGRGNALCEGNDYDNAVIAYDRALALNANLAEAWFGRGNVFFFHRKNYELALAAYDRALALKPNLRFGIGDRLHVKLYLSDWTNLQVEIADIVTAITERRPAISPFQSLAISSSAADQLACAQRFMADRPSFPAVWRGQIYSHDRIRLAYFSPDFCNHAVGQLAVGMFEAHEKSRFETIAISYGRDDGSQLRHRIKSAFNDFIDVREMTDAHVAAFIHRRQIDILVDLSGLTRYNRFNVLLRRVAPIQVNYLGYPGTAGAACMDYIIADPVIVPEDHFPFYSEKVVWLPDVYQPNDQKRRISDNKPSRSECGLPETGVVFCCFNNNYKITPEIFDIWMRLLQVKEGSVLWLIATNPSAERNLRREAEKRGISSERLIFAPKLPLADHLARSAQADLFLDTMPYNAHTTGSDALWAGVPLLTCLGSTFASRVGASLLKAVGLDELITNSPAEYEALALKLARESALLASVKAKLKRNCETYPLFDTALFTRHIESAYLTMWERYQRGEAPKEFAVNRIE